jgi:tyrosine-protein kinase Etk/Wzc
MIERTSHPDGGRLVDVSSAVPPAARPPPTHAQRGEARTRDLVQTLYEERWLVAVIAAATLALSLAYLALAKPVYESRIVVQVEENTKTLAGLEQLSSIFGEKRPADTEMAIMRSDVILGSVVSQLALDIEAGPAPTWRQRLLPRGQEPVLHVRELVVPDALLEVPLVLTALGDGRYAITMSEGEPLLEGTVGERAGGGEADGTGEIRMVVTDLAAEPGTRFTVRRRDRGEVVDGLRKSLQIAESGKATGIIEVRLQEGDPQRVAATLNAFASTYLRQNVERKSAEAEKTLAFLHSQLPVLKENLDRAESALEAFQMRKGSVSVSRSTEALLDRTVDVEREISELELQRAELRQKFTERHPSVVAAEEKLQQLRGKRAAVESRMKQLPATELESVRLTRDQKVAAQLYDVLLNKSQELRIARSGIVGNVRILDHARVPRQPAWPRRGVVVALALLLGVGGGFAAALLRRALDEGAEDPDEIEAHTGVPVFVTIPHSNRQESLLHALGRSSAVTPLAVADPGDPAVEGIRSLRTALQFALVGARNNVIAIGSPSPAVGKTFVSTNLALLLAAGGSRVLLVDADLRRGRVHRSFARKRLPGLSEVLTGAATVDVCVRQTDTEGLDLLSTGRIPPNPAELLASERFERLLATVSPRYDFVLVDTPPVLAVTDSTIVARCSGVNLLVLRAGEHPLREISAAVKQFTQNGFQVQGAILNDARSTRHGYGRYGRYYEYRSDLRH